MPVSLSYVKDTLIKIKKTTYPCVFAVEDDSGFGQDLTASTKNSWVEMDFHVRTARGAGQSFSINK